MFAFFILVLIFFKVFNFRKVFANLSRFIILSFSYLDKHVPIWFFPRVNALSFNYSKFFVIYKTDFFFEFVYFCPIIYYFYNFFIFIKFNKILFLNNFYCFEFYRSNTKSVYEIKYYFFYNFNNKKVVII